MALFVTVAKVGDVPDGEGRTFTVADREIAVFRCGDRLFATSPACTHAEAQLVEGTLDRAACTIECWLHGAEFDLATGAVLRGPATEPLTVFPVRCSADAIQVGLPEPD